MFFHLFILASMTILTALFTALIAAGSFIKVPVGAVPVTLQTLFVFMAGLLLPPFNATLSVFIFIVLGLIGLPIFTSGGGIAAFVSPTGGFIIGFLASVIVGSLLSRRKHDSIIYNVSVVLVMEVIIYLIGLPWLKINLSTTWTKAFAVGLLPFIPGDAIKIACAAVSSKILYPEVQKLSLKLREREKSEEEE